MQHSIFSLKKKRCHSLYTSMSSVSKDTDGNEISDIHVTGESEDMSAKERLLLWTQQATEGYAGIRCENFTTCWRDGKLFNA
uniref:Isoform 7 of Dystonin n=1 Tax=Homo sapiens TaxID=9606 RepID=Q03001-12